MKNLLMLVALGLIIIAFGGCFTVNSAENAVVVSYQKYTTYYNKPGLYFTLPFFNQINQVYIGNREAVVSIALNQESKNKYVRQDNESGDKQLVIDLLVKWRVSNVQNYFAARQKIGQVDFNKNFVDNILNLLLEKINGRDISSLNQLNDILDASDEVRNLGVTFVSIDVAAINFVPNNTQSSSIESQTTDETNILAMQNKMIESAYYQAHIIKTDAEIDQATKYDKLKKENPRFYNYFRLIDVYKTSAKDKQDVPAFAKLYY